MAKGLCSYPHVLVAIPWMYIDEIQGICTEVNRMGYAVRVLCIFIIFHAFLNQFLLI